MTAPAKMGQMVAAAWEKYVGSTPQDNVLLDTRRREVGFNADPITGPVSWDLKSDIKKLLNDTYGPTPSYLPTASLQCIHDWERQVTRCLWTCRQCGEVFTEFQIAQQKV